MALHLKGLFGAAAGIIPKWLRLLLLSVFALVFLLLIWGVGIEPRLISEEHEVAEIPGLPEAWQEQQVAFIADLQVGMWLANTDTIRRLVAQLIELRPAAVLIAGDFIYHPLEDEQQDVRDEFEPEEFKAETIEEVRRVTDLLRPLAAAGIPTYAVLGNHDYGIKTGAVAPLSALADRVEKGLEDAGIHVLRNEAVALPEPGVGDGKNTRRSGSPLHLVGIGSHMAHRDDVAAALAGVPEGAPRLVFMHNPATFEKLAGGTAPVALAAHTHGGQFRIPFLPQWSIWTFVRQKELHMDGWVPNYGAPGNRLYVNRGIGFSAFPVRINCPPELTLFTLRRAL